MSISLSKKKVISDLILNLVASVIPIMVLQLVIYPLVLKHSNATLYGTMVAVVSVLTVVPNTFGNVLNNIRLLKNEKYKEDKLSGDFNPILLAEGLISTAIILTVQFIMFPEGNACNVLLICIIGILLEAYAYYSVTFRLTLDYVAIVITNALLGIGFFLGFLLFRVTGYWEYVYILGYLLALIFVFLKSSLWKEPLKLTVLFKLTLKDNLLLLISGILYSLLNYADKLIIYPLIGAEAVAIYHVASIFGKIVSMGVSPLNSVMLSYLAKMEKISKNFLVLLVSGSFGISLVGYFACLLVAKPVLGIIYPSVVDTAMVYMPITTAIAMLTMLISVYYSFVLKFCAMKWQVVIDGVALLVYAFLSITLYRAFGLYGFCVGVMCSFAVKLAIMLIIFFKGIGKSISK